MNQASRLEKMQTALQSGLAAPGDGHRQRLALNAIALHSYQAGIGPLEYIVQQIREQLADGATAINIMPAIPKPVVQYSCKKCGRSFKSQTALNGHGEARCAGGQLHNLSPVAV